MADQHGLGLFRAFAGIAARLRGSLGPPAPDVPKPERPYRARKRSLPNNFSAQDRRRALEYWNGRCAVCGRPPGLWHTIATDHWIPLSSPDCPGTIKTNMVPLCHGTDGCNNQKYAKMPEVWLREKMGKRRAKRKLEEIEYFFRWMEDTSVERAACPYCGKTFYYSQQDDTWQCNFCDSQGELVMQYDD